ncbi:MAG: hypothetical protein V4604_01490 [Bacteroidota bacterium]|nr:MAG: hypothetical protein CHH17_08140 [Candidatus Fluviicola riflensis]OGS79677.1 MAG: hypothetical protein A3D31_06870 [Candidatus Fluviicola riflensis]OGS87109.1 MAG: hypothetical protein A2724_06330 [Fluviicola sp. RIFCSPHIGHO2_01_FULL_43_53]OGS89898.1 MAG: hypothetical protein A3E30_03075 [Fluviicola sp. RIFCSPHIGHO2_12_FULL_43_24]
MKKLAVITALLLASATMSYAQDCESLVKACEVHLKGKNNNFVSDGQVYTAFLDREKAEFKTTFFGGSTYRIAATAGEDDTYVIFTVTDTQGNLLFTNKNYKNSNYWDFKVPKTIPVVISTELDMDKKVTGCAVMMIGFKR